MRKHAGAILTMITGQYTSGRIADLRNAINRGETNAVKGLIDELREKANERKEFSASIVPTIVSVDKARSMKMLNGEKPTAELVSWWLYLQVSGVAVKNYIVNVLNVNEDARLDFLRRLMNRNILVIGEARVDDKVLKEALHSQKFPLNRGFCAAFAFLNYFAYWVKNNAGQSQGGGGFGLPEYLFKDWKITDKATLIVISLPSRQQGVGEVKRGVHFVPKLASFFTRWYADYWTSEEEYPPLGLFISSLYTPDYKEDESKSALDKFLYDLLNGRVNAQLLSKLALLRADSVFAPKVKKSKPISKAEFFLTKVAT